MHYALSLLLSLLAFAPTHAAPVVVPGSAALATVHSIGQSYVWTGRTKNEDGSWTDYANPEAFAKTHLGELAKIRAALQVDRKFDAALEKVLAVHVWSVLKQNYAEKGELLVQVALLRSKILAKLGRVDEMKSALEDLYLPEIPSPYGTWEFARADQAALDAQAAWLADPRIVEARTRLSAAQPSDVKDEEFARYVTTLVTNNWLDQLTELGPRAIPTLREWVDAEWRPGTGEEQRSTSALVGWIRVDRVGSALYLLEHFDSMNTLRRSRYLSFAMSPAFGSEAWTNTSDTTVPPTFRAAEWLTLLARMLGHPELFARAIPIVNRVADNDGLTPALQSALSKIVAAGDEDQALAVQEATVAPGRPSVYPVSIAALDSPFARVRNAASKRILAYASTPGLLRFATHREPAVRALVAESLGERMAVVRPQYLHGDITGSVMPIQGAEELAVLERLLGDADVSVATAAARSLLDPLKKSKDQKPAFSDAAVLRISKMQDPKLQSAVVRLAASPATMAAVFRNLLDSKHELDLYEDIDQALVRNIALIRADDDRISEFLPILRRRLQEGALRTPRNGPNTVIDGLARNPKGLAALMDWARDGVPEISYWDLYARYLVQMVTNPNPSKDRPSDELGTQPRDGFVCPLPRWNSQFWTRTNYRPSFRTLSDESVATLLRASLDPESLSWPSPVVEVLHHEFAARSALIQRLARDERETMLVRWAALSVLAVKAPADSQGLLVKLLTAAATSSQDVTAPATSIAREWPIEGRSNLVRDLLARPALPDALLLDFVDELYDVDDLHIPADVAAKVLERWMSPTAQESELLWRSLAAIALVPIEQQGTWLNQALHNPALANAGLDVIAAAQNAGHIDLVGQAIGFEWIPDLGQRSRLQVGAANYLTNTLSERAVEYLLKAMTLTRDDATRYQVMHGLDVIRRYNDERARWVGGRAQESARAAAIVELVPMLADKESTVRASAARSLGALRAVEHLPKLVRLLKDADKTVAAAAQQAIDQITTPEVKPGTNGGNRPEMEASTPPKRGG